MKAIGKLTNVKPLTIELYGNHEDELEGLREQTLDIEIKLHRKRRSPNANALCWQLCSLIGQAMTPPLPREEVYCDAIRNAGQCTMVTVRRDALEAFMKGWKSNGIGWFSEPIDMAQIERGSPYVDLMVYYGSSSYDTQEMSTLLDYLLNEAEQMELPIIEERKATDKAMREWAKKLARG